MKTNLHSVCFLFLIILFLISGFKGLASATEDPYSFNKSNYTGIYHSYDWPKSAYTIWGYTGKNYNFTANCEGSMDNFSNESTVVFYWNCIGETSNASDHAIAKYDKSTKQASCINKWDKEGTYFISVGIFKRNVLYNISYCVPLIIKNDTVTVQVQNISIRDERGGSGCNSTMKSYNVPNPTNSQENITNNTSEYYCVYAKNDYTFNVIFNAGCQSPDEIQSICDINTLVNWGNSNIDSREFDNSWLSDNKSIPINVFWNETFIHQWNESEIDKKQINVTTFYWDPLDGSKSDDRTSPKIANILIIRDPKNFVFSNNSYISFIIEPFSNLQNLGIFLVSAGLMILFFTLTKNSIPVKISLFGMKPFFLKSVDSFIGIFTFVAGAYLYFVFGRCPWDIPIMSESNWLSNWFSNMYFSVLYYEYVYWHFPYLSILLGLVCVVALSSIIYWIENQLLKGDLNIGKSLRGKNFLSRLNMLRISILFKRKQ